MASKASLGIVTVRGKFVTSRAAGRFTSEGNSESYNRNGLRADAMQAKVLQLMQEHIASGRRAAASTGRLLRVTANTRNQTVRIYGFGVGIEKYLDSSMAKYWRTFEYGSKATWKHPFVGTQLFPVGNSRALAGPHGATPGLRTLPKGTKVTWKGTGHEGRYVVRREIEPAGIYRQAWRSKDLRGWAREEAMALFRRLSA